MEPQDTLSRRINTDRELTEAEQTALLKLFGERCSENTKQRIETTLLNVPSICNYGIYDRVVLSPRVQYIAGQCGRSEIRTVRKCLIGG